MNPENTAIYINYTKIPHSISNTYYDFFSSLLNLDLKKKLNEYKFRHDKLLFLFGKILLIHTLFKFSINNDLSALYYNLFGRPYLSNSFDFNISHSGDIVCCAFSFNNQIGVDIENIKEIDFTDYYDYMNEKQWEVINGAIRPINEFYNHWTIKESVIKADSRGLSLPLKEIYILGDNVLCQAKSWYIKTFWISDQYSACIASAEPGNILVNEINIYELYTFFIKGGVL